MVFPEDTTSNVVTHPRAIEVMGEIDLALRMLSNAEDLEKGNGGSEPATVRKP